MRLMSVCATAMSAAKSAVMAPTQTTTVSAGVTPLTAPNEKTDRRAPPERRPPQPSSRRG